MSMENLKYYLNTFMITKLHFKLDCKIVLIYKHTKIFYIYKFYAVLLNFNHSLEILYNLEINFLLFLVERLICSYKCLIFMFWLEVRIGLKVGVVVQTIFFIQTFHLFIPFSS